MTVPTRRRTRARETALQLLFQFDLRGADYAAELGGTLLTLCAEASEGDVELTGFTQRLVAGTLAKQAVIDQRLRAVARNWDLARMANVDRNVLRMAIYELMFCRDVPPKVAINEAIELGKKFSTANSGGFINGILDRVRIDLEKERNAARNQPPAAAAAQGDAPATPPDSANSSAAGGSAAGSSAAGSSAAGSSPAGSSPAGSGAADSSA